MQIVMLTGSPHRNGTSMALAEAFEKGAQEKGHTVTRFDTAFMKVDGCRGCGYCREHSGACVMQDDMQAVYRPLIDAEIVAFVTPLYYWDMTAQLKAVVDRFFAVDRALTKPPKGTVLIATCNSKHPWAYDALREHYKAIQRHLDWHDRGMLLAQVWASGRTSRIPSSRRRRGSWGHRCREQEREGRHEVCPYGGTVRAGVKMSMTL